MKCLLLINMSSGNAKRAVNNKELIRSLEEIYGTVEERRITEHDFGLNLKDYFQGYDAVAVCGGDGTFNTAINAVRGLSIDLLYIPCGTFNDAAHTLKSLERAEDLLGRKIRQIDLGEFNGRLFSYVAAVGSFTAIGFLPKSKHKKLFKRLVYYLYAFKEYRLHRIKARIVTDDKEYKDEYTLLMAVKSRYVFGFPFNRLYSHNSGSGHMLLIKTPKGMFKLIKMFFLFFRTFFIGFNKEHDGKHIKFFNFTKAHVTLDKQYDFCVDGEKMVSAKENSLVFHRQMTKLFIP